MGSPQPWRFMDYNSLLLQDDHHHQLHPSSSLLAASRSSTPPSPSPSPQAPAPPSQLLSSQTSLGPSATRVSKRKSRAVCKPAIRVLSADRESFRDMVQQLTGIPPSPPMDLHSGLRLWGTAGRSPAAAAAHSAALYRPMPVRQRSYPSEFAAAHQSLPTLDTSSAYLAGGLHHGRSLLLNEVGGRLKTEFCDVGFGAEEAATAVMVPPEAASYGEGCNYGEGNGLTELESWLMTGFKPEELLQARNEPWLASQVEVTHSA